MAEKPTSNKPTPTRINEGSTKGNTKPIFEGPKTTPPPQKPPAPKK
jgi:hypothetical protein